MNLLAELKRRNVIRMAGLYLVGAWLIVQVAGTLLPVFDAPAWVMKTLVGLLAIAFVPALIFAWVFELTPQGIKRDEEVKPEQSIAPQTARRMDRTIIVVLMIALGYFGVDKFVLAPQRVAATNEGAKTQTAEPAANQTAVVANDKSIAVLPFENLSDDKANQYFATGMQDEILTRLAGIHDLKVISRTSTEQYASRPPNLKIVAEQLGVATVLEGSVQRAEGKVRINLQLIDARSDTHLWAQNYDRDLKDVFAVQSDVAEKVADALKAQLLPAESARITSVPTRSQEAYDRFLKAQDLLNQLDNSTAKDPASATRQAEVWYREAIALDPDFALAYVRLSYLKSFAYWWGIDPSAEDIDAARAAAQQALTLQPLLPEAHMAMGYVHYWGHREYSAALAEFATARTALPNSAQVIAAIGYVHRRQGKFVQSNAELQQAVILDPRDAKLPREIGASFTMLRLYGEADAAYQRSLALLPDGIETLVGRATAMMMSGDTQAAVNALAEIPAEDDPQGSVSLARFMLAIRLRQPDTALAAIAHAPAWITSRFEHARLPVTLLQGQALVMKGDTGAARAAFIQARQSLEELLRVPGEQTGASSYLAIALAGLDEKDAAVQAGQRASEQLPITADPMVGGFYLARLAMVEASVGEIESTVQHLEQLMAAPAGVVVSISSLRLDPAWDPLRKDPRFQALLSSPPTTANAPAHE